MSTFRTGTIYRANGAIEQVAVPPSRSNKSLPYLQGVVGGLIELVKTHDGRDMYINEEGKLEGKPVNFAATSLYKYGAYDPIVGDAIVIGAPRGKTGAAHAARAQASAEVVANALNQSMEQAQAASLAEAEQTEEGEQP